MIETFEEYTAPLTDEETALRDYVVPFLAKHVGKDKAVSNAEMCKGLAEYGYKVDSPRLRKIIHNIRVNNPIPLLIASSKGYYVSEDVEEVYVWLKSIASRIGALQVTHKAVALQMNQKIIDDTK